MATPTWNQLAAPNFSAGNSLIVQAMDQLTKAGEGLQGVAKNYKDTLYKRNLGLIQEYVNSAKTPEELQSEGFQTGLAKLTGTMAGEYDTLAKAQIVDKATDTLLSRKANQVSIDTNQFNLDTGRKNQLTKETTNKILAAPPEQRDALKQAAVDANAFDASAYQQYVQGEGAIRNQNNVDKLFNATYGANVENANLAPVVTRHGMKIADRNATTAEMNAQTNRLQAEAAAARAAEEKKNTKNSYIATGLAAIDTAKKDVKEKVYGSGLNTDGSKTLGEWVRVKKEEGNDPLPEYIEHIIKSHPQLKGEPDNIQTLYATKVFNAFSDRRALYNPVGWMTDANKEKVQSLLTTAVGEFKQQVKTAEDNATIPIYRKTVFEHAQKTGASGYAAAKDLGLDELTIYKAGIPSQLAAEAKIKYASSDKSIPEDQFIENEINIATNPDYASLNKPLFPESKAKAIPSENIKFNSPAMQMAGFADYGTAFRFEEREAEKAAQQLKASAKANQAQTGNPLQQTALPPNVNKLISTPLDILTNPSTIKTKPVADPLRQAALEQTPVATNNTSQPRQLPTAEKQQAERMNQEALFRLTGAKLEEKQAEVQKQFPTAPLKELAKAVTPVPSPLVPVESQNAYKVKENNLSINLSTGKSVPSKDPVPMPNVPWGKPTEVVTMNPMVAKLPQYKAVATFVEDGDTFKATSKQYATKGIKANGGVLCRVDSVDAPETPHPEHGKKGQPYGEEARKKLQQMILNKEISIRIVRASNGDPKEPGLYGRDICQIEVEGANVSTELIRAGAAWLYREYNNYFTGLETVEANAKAEGRGLFSDPNAVYPPTAKHNGSLNLR